MTEAGALLGRTAWGRSVRTPLRAFLRTETGSAGVLLAATVAALVWANVDAGAYERVWTTELTLRLGGHELAQTVREWVNGGLMTFFFFVVGLEARRELDVGELRQRRRVTLPALAGLAGMALPVLLYLAINAGRPSVHGWGAAMSTDTAFALGMLAIVGRRLPDRLRAFMLTVAVADDVVALVVIGTAYSGVASWGALAAAGGIFGLILLVRAAGVRSGPLYAVLGVALWVAMHESGIDPVVVGLAMGLLTYAYPAARVDLERASDLFRRFREQPTPELERTASRGLRSALSPNERLQQLWHPWTSYAIVPLFALANIGIPLDGGFLAEAYTAPVTLGIAVGYTVGKPIGISLTAAAVTAATRGRLRPPVGWGAVSGAGALAGIGFTVALLVSTLAFSGTELREAKLGVLTAAAASALVSAAIFRGIALLPPRLRLVALLGRDETLVDLAEPVDPARDHVRGPADAAVTLVEYGDFECPYCGRAERAIRALLAERGDVRYVWRHLPLTDVHPRAQRAAEAAEAAAAQGAFWELHDVLLEHQDALAPPDLIRYADEIGLDVERFERDLRERVGAGRIAEDVDSADLSGVSGTPTFFVNGRRHHGAYDIAALTTAVKIERARAVLG